MLRKSVKKWLYGSCPGFSGSFPYFGSRVYFPKGSWIFNAVCEQGIWEGDTIKILCGLIRPHTTYFDIGANIGLTSIPVLKNRPDCTVVSFEPSPSILPFLQRTAKESIYNHRWRIVSKALTDEVGEAEFFVSAIEYNVFDGLRDTQRSSVVNKTTVAISTLDIEWEALNRPTVSVIKIDIEGAELKALHGAANCINHERPHIVFEWNSNNLKAYKCNPESILKLAIDFGYDVISLPYLLPVTTSAILQLQMLNTESFLLAPHPR